MRLALALYRYSPFGGLERSFHAIACAASAAGHEVTAFTRSWDGPRPADWTVTTLAVHGWTNVGRDRAFAAALAPHLGAGSFDAVAGFNRLPGLDVFYAADPCLAASAPAVGSVLADPFTRRRATRLAWERAAADPGGHAHLLLLTERERERFQGAYGTPAARLHVLPPGLRAEFLAPRPAGESARAQLDLPPDGPVVLAVGSDFRRKGLDRTLAACAALPADLRARVRILAVGAGAPGEMRRRAAAQGLGERLHLLGGRTDVRTAYRAADVLVHPAREEPGGTVLLEAASQGVPVIVSGVVGYAGLLAAGGAARVLGEPFALAELTATLAQLLRDDGARLRLGSAGRALAARFPMEARTQRALAVIERAARERAGGPR